MWQALGLPELQRNTLSQKGGGSRGKKKKKRQKNCDPKVSQMDKGYQSTEERLIDTKEYEEKYTNVKSEHSQISQNQLKEKN